MPCGIERYWQARWWRHSSWWPRGRRASRGAAAHRDQNTYKRTRDLVGRTAPADMPLEMKSVLRRLLQDQLAKDKT